MKRSPLLSSGLALLFAFAISPAALAEEWKDLFDGTTLDGWDRQTEVNWHLDGDAIAADNGREGLLTTKQTYSDYEIEVSFRAKEDTKAGIYLSSKKTVTDPGTECYKLAIAPGSAAYPTGSLSGRQKVDSDRYEGWRTYRARVQGATVTVWLDGKQVVEYKDRHPIKSGYIGLEFDQGKVEFRKIRIKNLGMP